MLARQLTRRRTDFKGMFPVKVRFYPQKRWNQYVQTYKQQPLILSQLRYANSGFRGSDDEPKIRAVNLDVAHM